MLMPTLTDIMHELGDGTRLRVFQALLGGRRNVTEIVHELGLTQPQVSYHLKKLRESGLAVEEKEGRWVYYQAHWETADGRIRELLELMARWSGLLVPEAGAGTACDTATCGRGAEPRGIGQTGGGSGRPNGSRSGSGRKLGAGVRGQSTSVTPKRSRDSRQKGIADEEGRPIIQRPKKPKSDMDDFLL
jgi:DNA-binding transcriptional ArsR family regulator